ncbi:MAG TPA: ferrochelatase [Desulfobulbus sp.]|nr:ferrochelatase [Desulfobulbus sp.]HHD64227.1 ferrochelatase [Desulfobulbaceae bacterium]
MPNQSTTGILLLNLGGPEKPADVEPFLYNLFSDRRIIRLGPFFLQKFIARRIAHRRAPTSRANYKKIGGGSPILTITRQQAEALEKVLSNTGSYIVRPCMRYWHPFAKEVIFEMLAAGITRLVALPLYPHYSLATTGSSLADLSRILQKLNCSLPLSVIRSWPTQPEYIRCLVERVKKGLAQFNGKPVELVYSAHSLPKKFIDEGDPYVDEIQQCIAAVEQQTGIRGRLCYQSRSGPVEWLQPSTPDMLRNLADNGCRNILMVPVSFVSDHVETLYEIDILYRQMAGDLGMRLESTPGLNTEPLFIEGLKKLVLQGVAA